MRWPVISAAVALSWMPDVDVGWVTLGVRDAGLLGHRGFTHTPVFALAVGLVALLVARRQCLSWRACLHLGAFAAFLVGSHPVLDALAQDGRGMLSLWPFSGARYHFVWRPIPDAPVGLAFFTRRGLSHLALEFLYFTPLTFIALRRPGLVGRLRAFVSRPVMPLRARPE